MSSAIGLVAVACTVSMLIASLGIPLGMMDYVAHQTPTPERHNAKAQEEVAVVYTTGVIAQGLEIRLRVHKIFGHNIPV